MRRSIDEVRAFYGEPAGRLVRRLVARRLDDAWGQAMGCDVLGIGYATPWLDAFSGARRVIAAMPQGQGAEAWPETGRNATVMVEDGRLPFRAGMFDRVLMVHALEEAEAPGQMLVEAVRALAPAGRIILVAAARGGFWGRAENTPFGHGRPFSRGQLERLVREVDLEPVAWSQTLYVPPWRPALGVADAVERIGQAVAPGAAGIVLLEAARRTYARTPRGLGARAALGELLKPLPSPQPVPGGARVLPSSRRLRTALSRQA